MNVFISHSHHDKAVVRKIVKRLIADGHRVLWDEPVEVKPGENFVEKIEDAIREADAFIIVISERFVRSEWIRREYSAISLQQISYRRESFIPVIPLIIDHSPVPSYLTDRVSLDVSDNFEAGLDKLSSALRTFVAHRPSEKQRSGANKSSNEAQIKRLRTALREGQLTLICGAGISIGAGVPSWDDLLVQLLDKMMERMSKSRSLDLADISGRHLARLGSSSLILGKHLKINLGNDFAREVRDLLYAAQPVGGELIDAIVELARPKRDGRPLDSIVTFNFDCLLEEQLTAAHVANKAIFSEATRHHAGELPIYHVHGYLPRTGDIPASTDIVFSEDTYHSQFMEPFSWSNLVQLNKLTQNTCLFVGISLNDPNMRRLLDVAWRKNADQRSGHYIVKKIPRSDPVNRLDEISRVLEEEDANQLGLNVIWIDEFEELPKILREIAA